jgi:hypothetical protein
MVTSQEVIEEMFLTGVYLLHNAMASQGRSARRKRTFEKKNGFEQHKWPKK